MIHRIELVAASRSTVLVTGETGTGKELVARAVYERSAQRDLPFVKVEFAAIPETLLESELFGYVRGAFTGVSGERRRASPPWYIAAPSFSTRNRDAKARATGEALSGSAGARNRIARCRNRTGRRPRRRGDQPQSPGLVDQGRF